MFRRGAWDAEMTARFTMLGARSKPGSDDFEKAFDAEMDTSGGA
jgi:hypothetical protein